ncbi:MAG: DUF615 domain-containing protein [Desulfamplus sp.]|nr:DUF615 domain-containing protein [Desulfamplus sp.]
MAQVKPVEEEPSDDISQTLSRTQKKKAAQNLQKFGEFLVTSVPVSEIEALDISKELKSAINTTKQITKHGARKRQLQYIGVLMREADPTHISNIIEKLSLYKKF